MTINNQLCKTKYPFLLVHGIGFRSCKTAAYWGRIPRVLESHGAKVYFSTQDGWGTIETNGEHLAKQIDKILDETGASRINLIGHSKGGIDSRHLLSLLGAEKIASITTISTPNNGSKSMDLLMRIPGFLVKFAGLFVNGISRLLGDKKPNFYESCMQMTTKKMTEFNKQHDNTVGVYCQSFAAVMSKPSSDMFLTIQNSIVKLIEGENDGLVTPNSACWENFKGVMIGTGKRGVSHADVVDMKRRPFAGREITHNIDIPHTLLYVYDITDIYVAIAEDLMLRGL